MTIKKHIWNQTEDRSLTGRDLRSPHGIDAQLTFSDFVAANSNRLAYASALSVAHSPATLYNPLYIYSSFSLGKTHILNGIGNLVLEKNPAANIRYLSAEECVRQFLYSGEPQGGRRFWEAGNSPDFLLLDDIHQIAVHRKLQLEFLALCNAFLNTSRQLVVASAFPPAKIHNLLPQLRSRLEWGLIAEIDPPGQRTKIKISKKMAEREKLFLPDDVAFFLASTTDDMRTLSEHVRTLKAGCSSDHAPVDIAAAKSIVAMATPSSPIDIHCIQVVTARYFGIALKDMVSAKREKALSCPRQIAMYLCKKLTPASLKEIGAAFGNKHHSTVIHSQKRIHKDKEKNQQLSDDIDKIQQLLL